jgi:hypothetical protein
LLGVVGGGVLNYHMKEIILALGTWF